MSADSVFWSHAAAAVLAFAAGMLFAFYLSSTSEKEP